MKDFHKILFAVAFLAAASFAQELPLAPAPVAEPAPVPATVADSAAVAEPVVAAEPPPVAQEPAPVATEPPPAVPEPAPVAQQPPPASAYQAPPAPSEPIVFEAGLRIGLGASQFRDHIDFPVPDLINSEGIQLDPAFSLSVGVAFQFGFNKIFALAPELQYTLYRANGEIMQDSEPLRNLYEAGVYAHTLELPVLARFRFGNGYVEFGPQVGLNLYSKMYRNADYWRPNMNLLAYGVAAGGGVNFGGILTGIRGYFGLLEYAKDAKGIPWGVQLSLTPLVF